MSELERKAERADGSRSKIDVRLLKNSQYDHPTQTLRKTKLSERWHVFGDEHGRVQRDAYSAFLAKNSAGNAYDPAGPETAWQAQAPVLGEAGWYKDQGTNSGLVGSAVSLDNYVSGQRASPAQLERRRKKHNDVKIRPWLGKKE